MAAYYINLIILLLTVLKLSSASDYCHIQTCRNPASHTMCLFRSPQPQCSTYGVGLTNQQKDVILRRHNRLRRGVALGLETQGRPGPQPPALIMPDLKWDNELATIAQRSANTCHYGHDKCRDVGRFQVGQNIAMMSSTETNYAPDVTKFIQMWYDEVQLFNGDHVSEYGNDAGVGHYTQIVWAKTLYIGCGLVKYKDGEYNTNYFVCNYGPAGNFIGEEIYPIRT